MAYIIHIYSIYIYAAQGSNFSTHSRSTTTSSFSSSSSYASSSSSSASPSGMSLPFNIRLSLCISANAYVLLSLLTQLCLHAKLNHYPNHRNHLCVLLYIAFPIGTSKSLLQIERCLTVGLYIGLYI